MLEYELKPYLLKLRKDYCNRISLLEKVINPDNTEALQVRRHRKTYQYYISSNGGQPKYAKASCSHLEELAQSKYNAGIIRLLQKKIKAIDNFIVALSPDDLEQAYCRLSEGRRKLIAPAYVTTEMYAKQWREEEYDRKPIADEQLAQITQNGEKVRSKSEVLIANQLAFYKIPYKYEKPLKIGDVTYHPDFTVINTRTRRQFYWEHLGMVDDPGYSEDAVRRFRAFNSAGLIIGRDIIITAETRLQPINTRIIDGVIKEYLI